jgi:DNA-binding NarL/FixJ family response regulator
MQRVLIVEHHPQVLEVISDLVTEEPGLELAGVAGTAREAISLARRLGPDVVLIDMDEPTWKSDRLDLLLGELLPLAALVRLSAVTDSETDSEKESSQSPGGVHHAAPKSEIPNILRSLAE